MAFVAALAGAAAAFAAAAQQAQPAGEPILLVRPTLTCRTLSEIRLWDSPNSDSSVLQRTITEGSCRNLEPGTPVTVTERTSIAGFDYECIRLQSGTECVWAGAVSPPQAAR